jgi:hypothetical protein
MEVKDEYKGKNKANNAEATAAAGREKPGEEVLQQIRTEPGLTEGGKPFDHVVKKKVAKGEYRLQ